VSALARGEQEPATAASFLTRLEALAERHYLHRHPFTALMHAGRLDRGDLRLWVTHHYHCQTRLPMADALIVAKSADPTFRRLWVQRVIERDGRGEPGEPGGIQLWQRLAAAFGIGAAELDQSVLSEVRVALDAYLERVRAADLVTAAACSLTEHFAWRLARAQLDAWHEHYAFIESSALECFEHAVASGRVHADRALDFVQEHAHTAEQERRCLEAFTACCELSWRALDAIYFERRRGRAPYIEDRIWLMRLSALASDDGTGRRAAPGVLMAPEGTLSLSRTAYELLERCDGQRTLESIVGELAERHFVDVEIVQRDVATFVGELERRHLLSFRAPVDVDTLDAH